ncbi:hypothetical protein [Nonomuraea jabiensis]|uniref:hypothetical protein n=1 Tax=Nonomuraea jabiensis TaxID=882448 RepID=UPI003D71308D
MTAEVPRLARAHAILLLLLPSPAGHPARTVLVFTDDGQLEYTTPGEVLERGTGRILLTRMELDDSGIRVLPGTGGRLASGSGPRLDAVLAYLNDYLRKPVNAGCACRAAGQTGPGDTPT